MQKNETSANSRQRRNLLVLLLSLTLAVVSVTIHAAAARGIFEPSTQTLSVNDPRPVAFAAEMLEKAYGWTVTYEDPQYAYEGDLVDVTEKVSRNLDKYKPGEAPRVLVPRGGELSFDYSIDSTTKKPADSALVIQQLLDAYAVAGHPGVFRMERNGERLHIIGVAARDKNGVLTPQRSVFDTVITVPAQKRNGMELLTALCAAISQTSGIQVVPGSIPLNQLHRYETESGAKDVKAREFLSNELDRMSNNVKLSWQLFYDADSKTYYLNIHAVK
jgi:hypothetical protein